VVTVSIVFNLQALYVVVATVLCLLVYILVLKHRDRRNRNAMRRINEAVTRYLKSNGVEAHVTTYPVLGGRRFVSLIESKPSEKLRSSQVVETAVVEQVRKETGLLVERVFWRFPVSVLGGEAAKDDLYMAQGFGADKSDPGYEVGEATIMQFEHALSRLRATDVGAGR
jgi:hypothetical protein